MASPNKFNCNFKTSERYLITENIFASSANYNTFTKQLKKVGESLINKINKRGLKCELYCTPEVTLNFF